MMELFFPFTSFKGMLKEKFGYARRFQMQTVESKPRKARIAIGGDHAGFEMKEELKKFLSEMGYEYKDFGTHSSESTDYPVYGRAVGEAVASGECDKGIVICGTGIGISIAANKVPGVRAGACYNTDMARISREHNDTNVLALGARITAIPFAMDIVRVWLETEFSQGERHIRRIKEITEIENVKRET
jgi:ribose 5-phosphate isomerase B